MANFMRQTDEISHEKTWAWLRKENLRRETEPLRITAQNNDMRINYIEEEINTTQQNSKCRYCGDRDETNHHIINKYRKTRLGTTG